ncbi:MAG: metallophosphoesterase [Oscillospiraceae bacterium]
MAYLYAMSDIHGALDILKEMLALIDLKSKENKLILLGDYIDHDKRSLEPLLLVKNLQEQYGEQVVVLTGNHEFMLLEDVANKDATIEVTLLKWLKGLPYYYENDSQIYVHAGIDEEAGEYWKWGSEDYYFCCKYPHTIGKFEKDIIAGHIGTASIANDPAYHHVFWDGQSHYYIDGSTELSGYIPLLKYNTETKRYTSFEKLTDEVGTVSWQEYEVDGCR